MTVVGWTLHILASDPIIIIIIIIYLIVSQEIDHFGS